MNERVPTDFTTEERPPRSWIARWWVLVLAIIVALVGTLAFAAFQRNGEAPSVASVPPAPTVEQIEQDLDGQRFTFYEDAEGERDWTISSGEIRGLTIRDTTGSSDGDRMRVLVGLSLVASKRTISGALELTYARDDDAWALEDVVRSGPNFSAGDADFVLFGATPVPGDSLNPRDRLAFEVIVRYVDGEFQAPFDVHRRSITALFDSTFASDSLRKATVRRVEQQIMERWVPKGLTLRLLSQGRAPRSAALDSAEVSFDGCQYLSGWADAPSAGSAPDLATTSSLLGGQQAPGRALTGAESRALDKLTRERLALQGVGGQRLRARGTTAADLDGDGRDELLAAFSVGEQAEFEGKGIVIAARPNTSGATLLFERFPDYGNGFQSLALLGVADLDADGANEMIFREEGYEVYRYLIVSHRGGRFVDAFRGGGGGC